MDHTVLPATNRLIHKWNEPYVPSFSSPPQSVTELWLVFISRSTEGRRLNRPGWLGEILRWFYPFEDDPFPVLTGPDV